MSNQLRRVFSSLSLTLFFILSILLLTGPRVDNFQTLDPRKQELLEARFLGMRSTSNPAGGSGGNNLQPSSSHSVPPVCNLMATQVHQQQQQQQPSPSSLNASVAAAAAAALATPPAQFNSAAYSAPVNNHGPFFDSLFEAEMFLIQIFYPTRIGRIGKFRQQWLFQSEPTAVQPVD